MGSPKVSLPTLMTLAYSIQQQILKLLIQIFRINASNEIIYKIDLKTLSKLFKNFEVSMTLLLKYLFC